MTHYAIIYTVLNYYVSIGSRSLFLVPFLQVFHSLLSIVYSITPVSSFPNNEHIWGPCHFFTYLALHMFTIIVFSLSSDRWGLKVIINVPHTPQPNSCTPFDQEPTVSVKLIKRKWLITLHQMYDWLQSRTRKNIHHLSKLVELNDIYKLLVTLMKWNNSITMGNKTPIVSLRFNHDRELLQTTSSMHIY